MKKKEILFVFESSMPFYNGATLAGLRLMQALRSHYSVSFATIGDSCDSVTRFAYTSRSFATGPSIRDKLVYMFRLTAHLLVTNYDILHFNGYGYFQILPSLIGKIKGAAIYVRITGIDHDSPSAIRRRSFGWVVLYFLRKTHRVIIAISPRIQKDCVSFKNILIPNVVSNEILAHREVKKRNEGCYVGAIRKEKGVEELIRIWKQNNGLPELIMYGPLVDKSLVENLPPNVRYGGLLSPNEVSNAIASAAFLVSASKSEGLPNVVLEAMALGTLVIAQIIPDITDYLLGEDRGLLLHFEELDGRGFEKAMLDFDSAAAINLSKRWVKKNCSGKVALERFNNI